MEKRSVISLLIAAGLTAVSATNMSDSPSSWTCAYVGERLPRALILRGEDTVSAQETWTARRRLSLSDAVLTRASNMALARALHATRLIVVRCTDRGQTTTIEAQSFDAWNPKADSVVQVTRPLADLPAAIDWLASQLGPALTSPPQPALRAPYSTALAKAGPALLLGSATERAAGLTAALAEDPGSLDLRLSAVGALIAARAFNEANRVASQALGPEPPPPSLRRMLRFQAGVALLEAGLYAEARSTFESLRRDRETAGLLNNLGVSMFRLRDPAASIVFEQASFLDDDRQPDIAFNRCLSLLFDGQAETALPFLDERLRQSPDDPLTRLLRVWALRLLNREAERAEEWGRLMEAAPSFSALGSPDVARRLERIFIAERNPAP